MHLLKPARLDVFPGQPDVLCSDDVQPGQDWLEYPFHKSHPIICWLDWRKLRAQASDTLEVDGWGAERHPREQPGFQPR